MFKEAEMETEIDALSVEYDEESSGALIRKSSTVLSLIKNFEVVENTVENDKENCSNEEVKTGTMKDAEPFERTCVEEISSRENKELVEGGSNGHFLTMNSSNGSAVITMPANGTEPDKTQPNSKSEWSVYFVAEEGSKSRDFLDKEGEAIDYENKDAKLVKDEVVSQAMEKKTMTQANENQPSASETMMLESLDKFVRAQGETQLTDHWTRTLENGTSTGKVEEIVRVLKEQQSHDLLCPACGSCITKRVILRKRKRTSTFSVNRFIQDPDDDAQTPLLEDNEQITEDQNGQPDISHEGSDESEAYYGCLTCFSIFIRRDKENESFYCFPFSNPWRESSKMERTRPAAVKVITNSLSHQEQEHATTGTPSVDALVILPDVISEDIKTNIQDERINDNSVTHDQESNNISAVQWDEELQQDAAVQKDGSYKNDYMCSCIPVYNRSVWSIWPFKERINDQLERPLLEKEKLEKNLSPVPDESISHGILQSDKLLIRSQSQGGKESEARLPFISTGVESNSVLEKQDLAAQLSENTDISTDVTDVPVQTIVEVGPIDDSQPSDVPTVDSDLARTTSAQLPTTEIVTEWDILKSIVYGGLTVSLTSLGVVSSAAGGEAKTLMVIVMGLANLVAGLLVILNNMLDLNHYHQDQFIDTVGQRFWFNGSVAIVSYLIFGSLAPITYAFSFRKSDDRLHKFIATSAVALVCIILLALGKARVSGKSYIRTLILYTVTGFWGAVAGFFAGEYIKKLLEKLGFKTD